MIRIGDTPPKPSGLKTAVIEGKDPYERAAAIDRFVSAAKGRPSNDLMVVSGERAGLGHARGRLGRPQGRLGADDPPRLHPRRHPQGHRVPRQAEHLRGRLRRR